MTFTLLLVVLMSNGDSVRSPGFEFASEAECVRRAAYTSSLWSGTPGIDGIFWQCRPERKTG
jgi:hypothetical protein